MQVLRASNAKVWGAFLCGSTKTTKHSDWDLPFPSGVMKHLPTTWSDVAVVTASKETHKKTSLYPVPESIQILIIQLNCRFCLTSFIQPDIDYIFIHTQFLYWIINFCQTHWELEIKCWPPHGWAGPSLHCLPERLHHLPPEDPPTRLPPSDAEIEREREKKRISKLKGDWKFALWRRNHRTVISENNFSGLTNSSVLSHSLFSHAALAHRQTWHVQCCASPRHLNQLEWSGSDKRLWGHGPTHTTVDTNKTTDMAVDRHTRQCLSDSQ